MTIKPQLRHVRERRGITAAELARMSGISRQSVYQIEDGGFVPNTAVALRLARVLQVSVEDLFAAEEEETESPVSAVGLEAEGLARGQAVKLCRVGEQLTAVPISYVPAYLPAADGVVEACSKKRVKVVGPRPADDGKRLLIAGCDPALSLLSDQLRGVGIEVVAAPASSRKALEWLKQGKVHAAGLHLRDAASGEYNLPIIRRVLPNTPVRVVTFAAWEQGIVIAPGNPKTIRSVADLGGGRVSVMNREKGSGGRELLDAALRAQGIAPETVRGYDSEARGHLAAAYAVASGLADCCIAARSAARCLGLQFIPLAAERFDLCFAATALELPAGRAVLDSLQRARSRGVLSKVAGYDTAETGRVLV